jgi:alkanesulfonate monooxygenase
MERTEKPIIFTTCPPYGGSSPDEYLNHVRNVARWSDEAGCEGILVYTDNSTLDPWLLSQIIIQSTRSLAPLVAVQPVYMHPYAVAKAVSTLAYVHGRRVCLNMVAGGFKNDLAALNDLTPHEHRYDRLVEYTTIIRRLLADNKPVTFTGQFYNVHQLALKPPMPAELFPAITISGSSPEGLAAARVLEAIPVRYPEPSGESGAASDPAGPLSGIRVGIIARELEDAAWACAHERFPPDRAGKIMHGIAMKVSDSVWHKQLSDLAHDTAAAPRTYWLEPFQNYKTFCPYLVGTYAQVGAELRKYMREGCGVFILDVPAAEEDLMHIKRAFQAAVEGMFHAAATNR